MKILLFLIFGVLCWVIFAYDMENDQDIYTWLWLMLGVFNFILFGVEIIKEYIKEKLL